MTESRRLVLGVLDQQFQPADAPAIIDLAATTLAIMAAMGHKDLDTLDRVLRHATKTLRQLPPDCKTTLLAAAEGLVEALQAGKEFTVAGGFQAMEKPRD